VYPRHLTRPFFRIDNARTRQSVRSRHSSSSSRSGGSGASGATPRPPHTPRDGHLPVARPGLEPAIFFSSIVGLRPAAYPCSLHQPAGIISLDPRPSRTRDQANTLEQSRPPGRWCPVTPQRTEPTSLLQPVHASSGVSMMGSQPPPPTRLPSTVVVASSSGALSSRLRPLLEDPLTAGRQNSLCHPVLLRLETVPTSAKQQFYIPSPHHFRGVVSETGRNRKKPFCS